MKIINLNHGLPSKICLAGDRYLETKGVTLHEVALLMEQRLFKLSELYPELNLYFEVKFSQSNDDHIHVKVFTSHDKAKSVVFEEIQKTLSDYNKQILIFERGAYEPFYNRFHFTVDFTCGIKIIKNEEKII